MSLPYFPLYPTDFEADTSHLTLAEDGAYNRLLRLCWMTPGCDLPNDEAWIMRRMRARTDEEVEAVRGVLAEFFTASKGRLSNARLTREWHAATDAHEKRKNAGSKGGKAKALKTKQTTPSNAVAKPKQPEPEPEPYIEDTDVSSQRARKRASRLPADWVLPREWGEWAMGEGWPEQTIRREADKFKDYWIAASGQKATKLDWFATWRNWLRNVPKEDHHGNGNRRTSGRPNPHSTLFAAARSLAGDDDGGSADAFGSMRDVTPPGEGGLANGPSGDTSQSFLRIIDGRS